MKTPYNITHEARSFGIWALLFLSVVSARADPIEMPEKPVTPEVTLLITVAIFLEVACILLVLRHSRKPRFAFAWLVGMHLLTYPAFIGLLWVLQDWRPASAVAFGEGMIVLIEGALIYLMCHLLPAGEQGRAAPSALKCLAASIIGNVCSAAAFPVLMMIYERAL